MQNQNQIQKAEPRNQNQIEPPARNAGPETTMGRKANNQKQIENQNQNPVLTYHLVCPVGHQELMRKTLAEYLAWPTPNCSVCEAPLVVLGEAPPDRWGRTILLDDGHLPRVLGFEGQDRADETPLVMLRNHVAEEGFSYLNPDVRAKHLGPDDTVEIRFLMELGARKYLLAVVEPENGRTETALFNVEGNASGNWTIGRFEYQWNTRVESKPLPFGMTDEADRNLFTELETFIRENRCGDTWLFTPAAWKRSRESDSGGAILSVVSESGSGLVQRYHFGYAFDPAFSNRLDALLARHGVHHELGDHLTLHLYRKR